MIEDGTAKNLLRTKQWMYRDASSFHELLNKITDVTVDYLNMQIEAGAQALQVFDSWAGVLGPTDFENCSLKYLKIILSKLSNPDIPVIFFCRGSSVFANKIAQAQPAAISLDWNSDIAHVRASLPQNIALQGNIDPHILFAAHEVITDEAQRILISMKDDPSFIFNLGHGILPDTPVDAVKHLVDTVKCSVTTA